MKTLFTFIVLFLTGILYLTCLQNYNISVLNDGLDKQSQTFEKQYKLNNVYLLLVAKQHEVDMLRTERDLAQEDAEMLRGYLMQLELQLQDIQRQIQQQNQRKLVNN